MAVVACLRRERYFSRQALSALVLQQTSHGTSWAGRSLGSACPPVSTMLRSRHSGRIYGAQARSDISALTLLGGFASTVCWPLSAILAAQVGWRGTCMCYALLQIAIALPTYLLALRDVRQTQLEAAANTPRAVSLLPSDRWLFLVVAAVLTIAAAILSMMGTHLLPLLMARGLDPSVAVGLGAMVGPSQVGARFIETLAGRRYDPVWTMVASAVLVAIAAFMLIIDLSVIALAIVLYGAGNGIGSVARGTVPLAVVC